MHIKIPRVCFCHLQQRETPEGKNCTEVENKQKMCTRPHRCIHTIHIHKIYIRTLRSVNTTFYKYHSTDPILIKPTCTHNKSDICNNFTLTITSHSFLNVFRHIHLRLSFGSQYAGVHTYAVQNQYQFSRDFVVRFHRLTGKGWSGNYQRIQTTTW